MVIHCAECKRKSVFIDNTGQAAEFCSNQCRRTAVEKRHVQACIKCRIMPMIRLQDGSRSPFCSKKCQNSIGGNSPITIRPPPLPSIPLQPPQPYRPATYSVPPLNHPNPSIGMPSQSSMPILPIGNARPIGDKWVMATVPFCRYCKVNPCWKDQAKLSYSSYCTRRCKDAAEQAPLVVTNLNSVPFTSQSSYNGQILSPTTYNGILTSSNLPQYLPYQQNNIQQPQYQLNNIQPQQPPLPNLQQFPNSQNIIPQSHLPHNSSNNIHLPRQVPSLPNNVQYQQQTQKPLIKSQRSSHSSLNENLSQPVIDDPRYHTQNEHVPQPVIDNPLYPIPQAKINYQHSDDSQDESSQSSLASSGRILYPVVDNTMSNFQSSDNQTPPPPPIPTNKPIIQVPQHQQHISPIPINITINTSQPIQSSQPIYSSSSSQNSTENHSFSPTSHQKPEAQTPSQEQKISQSQVQVSQSNISQSQLQVQEQNLPELQVQSQVQEQNQPLSQEQGHSSGSEEINDNFAINPYSHEDNPPPYTPNDAYTGNAAPGEDISIRKVTRDDSFDETNPYGFRNNANGNDSNNRDESNQSNNDREQQPQRDTSRRK
ncbi:10163_t:CDS:2 [Funneliformis geosporum]|uniref:7403_t:CDS:1 n=1 Tax=Funneliformis geosporum TaxID=1117311 RepID=A0A9W4T1E5_9GLOM|nr:7403_t:CDS:2 [Funneliformis geosporum]CAI2188521.1 10163_t:CDS:2 [Funneliformis geosporum]